MAAHGLCKLPTSARMSHPCPIRRPDPFCPVPVRPHNPRVLQNPWMGISGLSVQAWNTRTRASKFRPIAAIVSSSPSTEEPVKASTPDETPRWSWASVKAISVSEVEVRKCRYEENRPETLLMGMLVEATSVASKFLRAHGITILKVRDENVKVNGEMDFFGKTPYYPPFSKEGQRVFDWAVAKKIEDGDGGEVTTPYLVLGIWSQVDSSGHKILANLGFNDEKAKELESLCSIPE